MSCAVQPSSAPARAPGTATGIDGRPDARGFTMDPDQNSLFSDSYDAQRLDYVFLWPGDPQRSRCEVSVRSARVEPYWTDEVRGSASALCRFQLAFFVLLFSV